jgi:hypothetical protein
MTHTGGLSKIEARLRRINDAELLMLAKVLKCTVAHLYPPRALKIGSGAETGSWFNSETYAEMAIDGAVGCIERVFAPHS